MKLLCVIDCLGSGGAQRQLVGLAIALKKQGHNISFLVYYNENFFEHLLLDEEIPVISIIERNYIKRLFKMRRYIRSGNYDAVLSFLEAGSFICEISGLPWRKWKLIVGERSANPNILKSAKLIFYRLFHVLADHVVSNSQENINLIKKVNPFLSLKKCHVIYNLVDFDFWKPANDYVPCKDGKLNLTVVASHQYLKNLKGLIEAASQLKEEEKQKLRINWYGNESTDNSLQEAKNLIEEYCLQEMFSFYPATKSINEKMKYADVIGLFSFYEGLPNVICEGMVLSKPVISSSVSDIAKLLSKNQELTFDPKKTKDILRTLKHIISLNEEKLLTIGKDNRELALGYFSANKIVNNYTTLLTE
jgi:glycosyltransferase involved in cell wall biosynthesis